MLVCWHMLFVVWWGWKSFWNVIVGVVTHVVWCLWCWKSFWNVNVGDGSRGVVKSTTTIIIFKTVTGSESVSFAFPYMIWYNSILSGFYHISTTGRIREICWPKILTISRYEIVRTGVRAIYVFYEIFWDVHQRIPLFYSSVMISYRGLVWLYLFVRGVGYRLKSTTGGVLCCTSYPEYIFYHDVHVQRSYIVISDRCFDCIIVCLCKGFVLQFIERGLVFIHQISIRIVYF